jgi:sigma-B regulation protein RsbU (phosphoserine phosphatase)
MSSQITPPPVEPSTGAFPSLLLVEGGQSRIVVLDHTPFTVGRKTEKDLVITDPRVSRDHAIITSDDGEFFVIDQSSRHGTYLNGTRVQRARLQPNDRLEFGTRDAAYVMFRPHLSNLNAAREFLNHIPEMQVSTQATDLEKLALFLEAARKLNTVGVLDEILVTLIESTLRFTGAERGYVFLRDEEGHLRLAAGRNATGAPLLDDKTISHSILEEAVKSASEFVVSDTSESSDLAGRNSIVAFDLRTVICIPLRRSAVGEAPSQVPDVIGALYLDARYTSRSMGAIGHDILRAIAREAAALVENARLVQAEQAARRYQQELAIAASIQQGLMSVTIPEVPFAKLQGRNISCKQIGGDFFDAVRTERDVAIVVADVCGKGITAALLASTLQGMIYSHLAAGMPLADIVTAVNAYLCKKSIGEKYATLLIARLNPQGDLEYVNCGHVPPVVVANGKVVRPECSNLPVGLLPEATFESGHQQLKTGDRVIIVTDGVTEAENAKGEFFEDSRLQEVAGKSSFEEIFSAIETFCAGAPLADDCTVVELQYMA